MKLDISILLLIISVFSAVDDTYGSRILAIIPTASYSHQLPFRNLWKALIRRGHEVVVYTTDPEPDVKLKNLTVVDGASSYIRVPVTDFVNLKGIVSWISVEKYILFDVGVQFGKHVYEHLEIEKLYAPGSNVTFDIVMTEFFLTPSVYALAHRFNAPLIGLASLGLTTFNTYVMGEIPLPSHPSSWDMEERVGVNLPFWRRLQNFITLWYHIYWTQYVFYPTHQAVAEKYLGKDIPSIVDIMKNTSLIFVNREIALTHVRPYYPNIIPFSSFHVSENLPPLSAELKRFIEGSPNGFIYFSLGTNARSTKLRKEIVRMFCDTFQELPYNVLWKFEAELEDKPSNVYIAKWLPQQSILAHPNIKLFIYQGGLQSTEEAVHFGVPVLGTPILADQYCQVQKMVSLGVGKYFDFAVVTTAELKSAIVEIINDKGYKERMRNLRRVINDQPRNTLDHFVQWTEFVIRHKGAPQFQNIAMDTPWYARYDMDIIFFLGIVTSVVSIFALFVTYKCLIVLRGWTFHSNDPKVKVS